MAQKILKPNKSELEWIRTGVEAGRAFVQDLTGETLDGVPQPHQLDQAFAKWLSQHNRETEDPNPIINLVGLTFGQYLADSLNLNWVVVRDSQGTEIAVHGQPGNILVFPPNLIAKRYTTGETGFLQPIFDDMKKQIELVRAQTPKKQPWWKFW